ncbi:MAG: hypothetical protein ACR2QG_01420, partial [Gammaproteobacteria bacterium]
DMTINKNFGSMPAPVKTLGERNMNITTIKIAVSDIIKIAFIMTMALLISAIMTTAQAVEVHEPPPFEFSDRCVPYEVDPNFMLANGVNPNRILTTFGGGTPPDDGTGNSGTPAPWTEDLDGQNNPVNCDEFHTNKRRTRYEGCHFYDGSPCFFTTNGQYDQDAFTDDEAGRIAFEISEHFVIYEVVQNFPAVTPYQLPFPLCIDEFGAPQPPPIGASQALCEQAGFTWKTNDIYSPAPIFSDPFAGGFAVGTQVKIMNATGAYFQQNPLGLWKIGFIQFTNEAGACVAGALSDDCDYLQSLVTSNGMNSQMIGFPLIFTGDEIFELTARGLASIRYRGGADGVPGGAEGPRYILCPVHENPALGSIFPAGNDIIQAFPTHIEFQPPDALFIIPDFSSFPPRGHTRISFAFPFGPTPPAGEQHVYDEFDCLQRTGLWCDGGTVPPGREEP